MSAVGTFSDYQVHKWLDDIAAGSWVSLHYDSPLTGGAYASEFSGEGYSRIKGAFTPSSNRTIWNTNVLRFTGLPAGTVTWVAGFDAPNNGNLQWANLLVTPRRVLAGGYYVIIEGDLALSFG